MQKSNLLPALITTLALALTLRAAEYPAQSSMLLPCVVWILAIIVVVAQIYSRRKHNSEQANVIAPARPLENMRKVFGMMPLLGPHACLADVKALVIQASEDALDTDLVALFTIDPSLGGIECDSTEAVTTAQQDAFLNLAGHLVTERDSKAPCIIDSSSSQLDSAAVSLMDRLEIGVIMACPIRSELGASGAVAAFYPPGKSVNEDMVWIIEAIAAQASAMISYSLAIEQSSNLLDDLAGVNQELSVQATMDGLTGLANHRTFSRTLEAMCKHKTEHNRRTFCLVMVDVDHFKVYNDTYGHQAGDAVLRTVARVLGAKLRHGDLAARYGGEEFALLLKGARKDTALAVAERIRYAVARQTYECGSVTVSMGIAEFPTDGVNPNEVIEKADRALYHAKITGRNRVIVWGAAGSSVADPTHESASGDKTVLLVEDPNANGSGDIGGILAAHSCRIQSASTAAEAVELLRTQVFDIAFVCVESLPDGRLAALTELTSMHPDMPVVLVTSSSHPEESREALQRGASDTLLRPYNSAELPILLERNVERCRLERERMAQRGVGLLLQSIDSLVAAIDAKDHHSTGHSQRVTALAVAMADELGMSSQERTALEFAARLHDIGKIALPDSALNKHSKLTDEEWAAMRRHPITGSQIVGSIDELAYVGTIIRHHHERLNGTGYPDGLRGDAIPYPARIIAVADAYEAMTSERSYRAKLTSLEALDELKRHEGTFYSPEIVAALAKVLGGSSELAARNQQAA